MIGWIRPGHQFLSWKMPMEDGCALVFGGELRGSFGTPRFCDALRCSNGSNQNQQKFGWDVTPTMGPMRVFATQEVIITSLSPLHLWSIHCTCSWCWCWKSSWDDGILSWFWRNTLTLLLGKKTVQTCGGYLDRNRSDTQWMNMGRHGGMTWILPEWPLKHMREQLEKGPVIV